MASPNASAIVSMEVFVEEEEVLPTILGVEDGLAENRALTCLIREENREETARDLDRDLPPVHPLARAGGTLNLEMVGSICLCKSEMLLGQWAVAICFRRLNIA